SRCSHSDVEAIDQLTVLRPKRIVKLRVVESSVIKVRAGRGQTLEIEEGRRRHGGPVRILNRVRYCQDRKAKVAQGPLGGTGGWIYLRGERSEFATANVPSHAPRHRRFNQRSTQRRWLTIGDSEIGQACVPARVSQLGCTVALADGKRRPL